MYFPTSLKLVGAVLLYALVVHALPIPLSASMTLKKLMDSFPEGKNVWENPLGCAFTEHKDVKDNAQFNPDQSTYRLYRTRNWMEGTTVVTPAFGLTKTDGKEMSKKEESRLKKENVTLTSGLDQSGRYWVVMTGGDIK